MDDALDGYQRPESRSAEFRYQDRDGPNYLRVALGGNYEANSIPVFASRAVLK